MVNKSTLPDKKIACILLLIVFLTSAVCAEKPVGSPAANAAAAVPSDEAALPAADESASFVGADEKGGQFITQKLVWDKTDGIYFFDVHVEQKTGEDLYVPVFGDKTENNFIELNLPPGWYRYKIAVYNLLRKLETESDWIAFEVIKAVQPELSNVTPKTIYLEEKNDGIYDIDGKNLLEGAEFILHIPGKKTRLTGTVVSSDERGRNAKIQFNLKELDVGRYTFKVTNHGGLYAEEEDIIVRFKKRIDFDVFAGYTCAVITADDTFKEYMSSSVWPFSAVAGCTFIPFKSLAGYFGIGVVGTYTRMSADFPGYTIDGNLLTSHLNFVYQLPIIKKRLVFEVHGGPGIVALNNYVFHFQQGVESDPLNSTAYSFDAGINLQLYVTKRLYTEVRCDYVMSLFSDMSLSLLLPAVTVGWQF